jgi:hypothetical protein
MIPIPPFVAGFAIACLITILGSVLLMWAGRKGK